VTELDRASLLRILPATHGPADWDDVLRRSGAHQRRRRRRLVVAFAAAALLATVAAAALGTVRDLFFGTERTAWGSTPTWSPDGRRIAYTVYRYPAFWVPSEVYVMNADGSGQRNLTEAWGRELFPIWSPDWRRVAYIVNPCSGVRGTCTGITQIYRMNADGTGRRRLARGVTYRQISGQFVSEYRATPTWSPDGRSIAFVSDRTGSAEVYVMSADGSGQRRLTRHAKPKELAWSPDGRMIAFGSHARGGPRDVYVMNADGTGLLNLTPGPGGGEALSWSPDGRKIGFRSLRDGSGEIYVVNVDGTGLRRLTHLTRDPVSSGGTTWSAPAWSPDGQRILFVRIGWGNSNSEILVMNADGSRQRNLTRNPAPDGDPVWSPDGRKILFVSKRDGYGEVYVMNADGSGQRNLTRLRERS
jgi:Tol biopolymer transport system component